MTEDEHLRIEALNALQLLDTPREERFDRITRLARRVFGVPMAAVTLVDVNRTWFKSCVGLEGDEVPRAISFCDYAIRQDGSLIVPDAKLDPRFQDHPLGIRFYAGRPLTAHGRRIGTLCLMDHQPREFGPEDRASLYDLARLVEAELDTVNLAEAWLTAEESRDSLKRERDFTAAVLQTAGSLVMVCDRQGRIVRFNQACEQVSGYTFEEAKGRLTWELLMGPEQAAMSRDTFLGRRPADYPRTAEITWLARDGRRRQVRWTATALLDAEGAVDYVVGTGTDITERAALERLKDEFLGVVSHELRTPLTSIRGALGLLAGGMLGEVPPKGQRMLEIASLSADRLARLVNDLLDVERLESGHLALDYQACNTEALMEQAVATMQGQAAEAHVTLALEPVDEPLYADPDRVIQVLTNLLGNAVKFSAPGGKVWLRAERRPDGVHFEVRDQGRGIPEDKLELIFDRFRQVDASDSREKGGTGLGLAICRGLVAQHGGRIWAENAADRGAVFHVVLPARSAVVDLQPAPCPRNAS